MMNLELFVRERIPMQKCFAHYADGRVKKITGLEGDPTGEIAIRSPFDHNLPVLESGQVDRGKLRKRTKFFERAAKNRGSGEHKEGDNSA